MFLPSVPAVPTAGSAIKLELAIHFQRKDT